MVEPLILLTIFVSFFATFIVVPLWIKRAHTEKMSGKDMQKVDQREVAEGGGINVLFGAAMGILLYVAIQTFVFKSQVNVSIFAILCVMLISSIVGMVDDLLEWKKGLSKKVRILVVFFAAIPLMVINAGMSSMAIPFFGTIDFGIWYPLLLIPLGVIGVTTTYNFLAGMNGLEATQGMILLTALSYVTYITGNAWLSVVALCMVAALFGFWIFNKYPARVFPGDVLTYSVGALIASMAIIGNIEKIAVFFFIPYIIEVGLKLRGRLNKQSFAKVNPDGSLDNMYKKKYSLTHVAIAFLKKIKGKAYEKEVVCVINLFQILIILLGLWLFVW